MFNFYVFLYLIKIKIKMCFLNDITLEGDVLTWFEIHIKCYYEHENKIQKH